MQARAAFPEQRAHLLRYEDEFDEPCGCGPRSADRIGIVQPTHGDSVGDASDTDLPSNPIDVSCEVGHAGCFGDDDSHERDRLRLQRVLEKRDADPDYARVATSKLCSILYAHEMDRRIRRAGMQLASIAYDPGFIPETGMGREAPSIFRSRVAKFVLKTIGVTMGRMPFSGDMLGVLAVDPAFADASGRYYRSKNGILCEAPSSAISYDEGKAAKLWRDSEELVHLKTSERPRRFGDAGT